MTKLAHLTLDNLNLAPSVIAYKNNATALDRLVNLVDLKDAINHETSGIQTKALESKFNAEIEALLPEFNGVTSEQLATAISGYYDHLGAYIEKRTKPFLNTPMKQIVHNMLNDNNANTKFQHGILIMDTLGDRISMFNIGNETIALMNNLEFSLVATFLGLSLILEDIHSFEEEKTLHALWGMSREEVEPILEVIISLVAHQANAVYDLVYGVDLDAEAKEQRKLHINGHKLLLILE